MKKNTSMSQRIRENWASFGTIIAALLGILCFTILISGSFEATETPATVIAMATVTAILSAVCLFWRDLYHALSLASFITSLAALGAFVAGRVSYVAYLLSGDVMGTGLSPLFVLSAVLFVLAVILSSLSMAQPFDAQSHGKAVKCLILAIVTVAAVAAIGAAVVGAMLNTSAPISGKTPNGNGPTITTQQPSEEASVSPAESKYKTPTQPASYWQDKSADELAAEDVSGKAIAYQWIGKMDGDRAVDLLINLYEDGLARIYQLSNGTLTYEYNGYWRNKDDEALYFGVSNYSYQGEDNPAYNVVHGQTATVDYSYDLVVQDSIFSFGCNFCLGFADGGQFVRSTMVEGDGSVKYKNVDEFLAALSSAPAPTEAPAPSEAPTEDKESYPANTLVLTFTPDISEKLKTEFYADKSVWGNAFAGSGDYTPTDSTDVLFSWNNKTPSYQLDFHADGTYEYRFTSMNIAEAGTWTWSGWQLTATTANGKIATAELTK